MDTEQAQPPAGKSALAVTAPAKAAVPALAACSAAPAPASSSAGLLFSQVTLRSAQLPRVNVRPLPPPVITLSHAQIAEIKG